MNGGHVAPLHRLLSIEREALQSAVEDLEVFETATTLPPRPHEERRPGLILNV
jgi:hypothetical protein